MPARWATALPMIVLFWVLAYSRRHGAGEGVASASAMRRDRASARVDDEPPGQAKARGLNAVAEALDRNAAAVLFGAATLGAAWFLLFEVSGSWLTVAWGLQGVALLVAGFALRERGVRLTGLALLGVCIAKLFLYDVAELEMVFRIFSFIILGALLLAVSFVYSRYREQIRRLL
jgi:uncharacterized membrane protein